MAAAANEAVDQTVTVSGVNLTADISATLGGTDANKALYTISPATIAKDANGAAIARLRITFAPTATSKTPFPATLTLASTGADSVVINLNGVCQ